MTTLRLFGINKSNWTSLYMEYVYRGRNLCSFLDLLGTVWQDEGSYHIGISCRLTRLGFVGLHFESGGDGKGNSSTKVILVEIESQL